MFTQLKKKIMNALGIALILSLLIAPLAFADNVQNDVTVGGNDTFFAGGSTTVNYRIVANSGDGQAGCNASDGSPAMVTINVSSDVTPTPGLLTFAACSTYKSVEFTSTIPGDYDITVSVSDSGAGTYNTNPAKFTLHVLPPVVTNNPPSINVGDFTKEGNTLGGWILDNSVYTASDPDGDTFTLSCSPSIGSVLPLGANTVSCTATDSKDASASDSGVITVQDTTKPVLVLPADITETASGSPFVNVNFTASATDTVSGTVDVSCNPPSGSAFAVGTTIVNCSATDGSSNTASGSFSVTVEDITPPEIVPSITGTKGNNDWFVSNVSLTWAVTDLESSFTTSGCDPVTVQADQLPTDYTCSATSSGGTNSVTVTIKRDATAPEITATLTPASPAPSGWYNLSTGAPSVSFACNDATSGLAGACPGTFTFGEGQNLSHSETIYDNAGNHNSAGVSNINVDLTKPTITFVSRTPANSNNWNNSDVTVTWSCSDSGSGVVASTVTKTVSSEGANQTATGTCVDLAGNTASDTVGGINIDKTAPAISIIVPFEGASYILNQSVAANYTCTDSLSGFGSCSGTVANGANIDTTVGAKTFTVNAVDLAGNSATKSVNYSVKYGLCVLYDQSKSHKSGSTIPLKLQLCDVNGVNVSSYSIVVTATGKVKMDNTASGLTEDSGNANPDYNFRYDPTLGTTGGYIYNLSLKGYTSGTWKVTFSVDGVSNAFYFVQFDVK